MEKGGCYRYGLSFGEANNTKSLNNGGSCWRQNIYKPQSCIFGNLRMNIPLGKLHLIKASTEETSHWFASHVLREIPVYFSDGQEEEWSHGVKHVMSRTDSTWVTLKSQVILFPPFCPGTAGHIWRHSGCPDKQGGSAAGVCHVAPRDGAQYLTVDRMASQSWQLPRVNSGEVGGGDQEKSAQNWVN